MTILYFKDMNKMSLLLNRSKYMGLYIKIFYVCILLTRVVCGLLNQLQVELIANEVTF